MSTREENTDLAVASSVAFPYHHDLRRRRRARVNLLPGAWIDEEEEDDDEGEEEEQVFQRTVSSLPPQLSLLLVDKPSEEKNTIEILKQTIDKLRLEKERLEETNDIVKKSIQIVARKRIIAQTQTQQRKSLVKEEDEDDIVIIVPNDFVPPTHDEMIAAGLDGWEWITAY